MAPSRFPSIEAIPLGVSLHSLSQEACLAYSLRHCTSAEVPHPTQHPLMHQLGSNPDCRALGLSLDGVMLAHCFYHYRLHDTERTDVVVHNFAVEPRMRGRGLGTLLGLELLATLLAPRPKELLVELEFSVPVRTLACETLRELLAETIALRGPELERLRDALAHEQERGSRRLLKSLVTRPEFCAWLQRKEVLVGLVSGSQSFLEAAFALDWPADCTVYAFEPDALVDSHLEHLQLLVMDRETLRGRPQLRQWLAQSHPGLSVAIAGEGGGELYATPLGELMVGLERFLSAHSYSWDDRSRVRSNLLGVSVGESVAAYRDRCPGGRLFIAASGPSLAEVDAEALAGETILTVNDALLKFPSAQYAAVMDSRKLHELHEELQSVDAVFTLSGNSFGVGIALLGPEGFSSDLEAGAYSGYTTSYFALQVAIYMGFREIYFLGLDLGNTSERSHFFGNRPLQERNRDEVYARMRRSFEDAVERLRELGVRVANCSPVSELTCFRHQPLDSLLQSRPRNKGKPELV